jgi:hypothetical protein
MQGGQLMVVLIVAIVMVAGIVKSRYRAESSGQIARNPANEAEAARLRDEIRGLKDRIAVLERVITDNHSSLDLDREIEKLRNSDRV